MLMLVLGGKKLRETRVRNKVNEDEGWEITEMMYYFCGHCFPVSFKDNQ